MIKNFKQSKKFFLIFFQILFMFLFSSGIYAITQKFEFGICEINSNCESCIEKFKFSFFSDFKERRVIAIGFDKGGKAIWREYDGCQMENSENWRCTGFHGDYVSRGGVISLEKNSKTIYELRKLEICNFYDSF